jgi:mono/diheme cytochrome c family protein
MSVFAVALISCSSEKKEQGASEDVQLVTAKRYVEVTPEKISEGKTLFTACSACHGTNGEGNTGIGPRLNSTSFLAAASDHFLIGTITYGRAGTTMIPWGKTYQPDQIESIVAYLRSLKDVAAAELDMSPLDGNPQDGEEIYRSICSSCHGRSGAGYQETANGTGIGREAFLSKASDGYLRYIIKHGKDQTKMRPFDEDSKVAVANLTDRDIDGVITYLRKNAW